MKNSPSSHALVSAQSRAAVPVIASAREWVLVVLAELTKAIAATHRYERLKCLALESNDRAAKTARQIFMEFYSNR